MKKVIKREVSYLVILVTISILILFASGFYVRTYRENTTKLKEDLEVLINKIPKVHFLWLQLSDLKLTQFSYEEFIEHYNTPYKQYYLFMTYRNNNLGEKVWGEFQNDFFFKDALVFNDLLDNAPYKTKDKFDRNDYGYRYISESYFRVTSNGFWDSTGKIVRDKTVFFKIFKLVLRPKLYQGWTRYFRVISIEELKRNYDYKIDWEFILNQKILNEYYKGDLEQLQFQYNNHEAYNLLGGSVLKYDTSKNLKKEIAKRDLFIQCGSSYNSIEEEALVYVLCSLFFILFILRYSLYALKNLKKVK